MLDPDLLERAVRRIAERRIENAMERGEIDPRRLRGGGQPIPRDHRPMDMDDWVKDWLDRQNVADEAARGVAGRAEGVERAEDSAGRRTGEAGS